MPTKSCSLQTPELCQQIEKQKNGELSSVILPAAIKKTCVASTTKSSTCKIKITVLSLQKNSQKAKGGCGNQLTPLLSGMRYLKKADGHKT